MKKNQWTNNLEIRGLPESDETEDKRLADLQSIQTAVLTDLKQYGI